MKGKLPLFTFLIVISLLFTGCARTAASDEELIKIAREEIKIADSDTIDMQIAGSTDIGNSRLIWFVSGNQYQAHSYLPIEFKVVDESKYQFVHTYMSIEKGVDISVLNWKDRYTFVINNDKCQSIKTKNADGQIKLIKVEKIPFVYCYEGIPSEYYFLDANENELR